MEIREPMTKKELIELAALDALGLLDEFEEAVYTRMYYDAPTTVQEEVLRLQADVAGNLPLLPAEDPDRSLRERVLKIVAEAVAREESRLAPLARIGRRRSADDGNARSRLGFSGHAWRAASFVLAGVSLLFALLWVEAYRHGNEVSLIALNNNTSEVLEKKIAPTIKDFLFDGGTNHVVLKPKPGIDAKALLVINESTRKGMLLTDGLDQAGADTYTLRFVNADQKNDDVYRFGSTGGLQGKPIGPLPVAALSAKRWEIVNSAGIVILASA